MILNESLILFIIFLLLIIHSFFFYPVILILLNRLKSSIHSIKENQNKSLSILIAAYNEEKVIKDRIENLAEQNYDFEKVEVFVGSDNSKDKTDEILLELSQKFKWLKFFSYKQRGGKAGVLNKLINEAKNEIIVFTDANTIFDKDVLKNLVKYFDNNDIGGVCGKLILKSEDSDDNEESRYWSYETMIKQVEGDLGISIAANGGIFAIRKELYTQIPTEKAVTDDLFLSLKVLSKGYKFAYASDARAYENTANSLNEEMQRKIRFSATNFQTLLACKDLLFHKNLLLSYAFWSHKVIRWFLPLLLIFIFISNYLLISFGSFYNLFFILQVIFYAFSFIGFILYKFKIRFMIFTLPYYFYLSNYALVMGFIKFIKGQNSVIWESTKR
jgi:cellulose synthase/poly-beta-1,6-N-acetylglucosamine synthase-like glycosyltransferase